MSFVRHSWLIDLLWMWEGSSGKAMCHVSLAGRLAPWCVGFAPVRGKGQLCRPVKRHDPQRLCLRSGAVSKPRPVPDTKRGTKI